jgi:hypothetical protein
MRVPTSILLLLSGATAGAAFVLSCGDNWHLSSDAAIDAPKTDDAALGCDCPAAEPPLAHRFVLATGYFDLDANAHSSVTAFCPGMGMRLLGGHCKVVNAPTISDVTLKQSGFFDDPPTGWRCSYRNDDPVMHLGEVGVLCLAPAP